MDRDRIQTRVAVYLVALRDDQVLLGKRQNTGHLDGYWSLPAGHVREGEACSRGLIREVQEECGVILEQRELYLAGAIHRRSGEFDYIDYIFRQDFTDKVVMNLEPKKCALLEFFELYNLPKPIDEYSNMIINKCFEKTPWIIEQGW